MENVQNNNELQSLLPREFTPNGCGPEGASLNQYIPTQFADKAGLGGFSTIAACNQHDRCYSTIGVEKSTCDRGLADGIMDSCQNYLDKLTAVQEEQMRDATEESSWFERLFQRIGNWFDRAEVAADCHLVSNSYWLAVNLGGQSAFDNAQAATREWQLAQSEKAINGNS